MSVRVGKFKIVYESVTMTPIDPEYLSCSREDIEEYMKENPMPDDPAYSKEDLINDLTKSSGFYTLPDDIKPETESYITEIVERFL